MEEILFAKISNERNPEFQVITEILERDGTRYVKKMPLQEEGHMHVSRIYENAKLLREKYADNSQVKICNCEKQEDSVLFEYIKGDRFDEYFGEVCVTAKKQQIIDTLDQYYKLILPMGNLDHFVKSQEFIEVFGDTDMDVDVVSGTNVNIDMIFPNIILNEGYYIIDYEWIFPFPIPLEFVLYRAIITSKAFSVLDKELQEEIYWHFGLSIGRRKVYHEMEVNFQSFLRRDHTSLSAYAKKFQLKCIHIGGMNWESQGYFIKCFGRKGELADEIYSGMIQNGTIHLEFLVSKLDYETLEIFAAPIGSVIGIRKILGYKGDEVTPVKYSTTADCEMDGIGYYGQNTPVFIIENDCYEKIVCQYDIKLWNNPIVDKMVSSIRNEEDIQEKLRSVQMTLYLKNDELLKKHDEMMQVLKKWDAKQEELQEVLRKLNKKDLQLEEKNNENHELKEAFQEIIAQKKQVENELNLIKNSKTWRTICKIRGWK